MERPSEFAQTPWWYRIPPMAVGLITYSGVGIVLWTAVTKTPVIALGGGLVAGLLVALLHGAAQQAHDNRRRP